MTPRKSVYGHRHTWNTNHARTVRICKTCKHKQRKVRGRWQAV